MFVAIGLAFILFGVALDVMIAFWQPDEPQHPGPHGDRADAHHRRREHRPRRCDGQPARTRMIGRVLRFLAAVGALLVLVWPLASVSGGR